MLIMFRIFALGNSSKQFKHYNIMKFEDFKNAVNEGLSNCPSFNVSFKQVGKYFIAIVTRNDCCFMMTQPLLEVAHELSISHGFQYYVDCDCSVVRLKIAFEL